jgi:hypothetical protein
MYLSCHQWLPTAIAPHFAVLSIKGGELLIVACSEPLRGKRIVRYYSWRWFIECMFADCKTKGFNLEDTRLRLTQRLSMLVAVMAIAMAMACHVASRLLGTKYPARKKHGYCSKSWFRTGLDELRRRIRTGGSPSSVVENTPSENASGWESRSVPVAMTITLATAQCAQFLRRYVMWN